MRGQFKLWSTDWENPIEHVGWLDVGTTRQVKIGKPQPPKPILNIIIAEHFSHRDENLAFSYERIAGMSGQHVIEHQDVTSLPPETYLQLPIHF